MKFLFGLLLSYVLAAPLTERISLDLRQTHWWDIMTYVIWAFSLVIWLIPIFMMGVVASYLSKAIKRC